MKVWGLTGGPGMGKTTTAGLLRDWGASVVDTDDLARQLVLPGKPALAEIHAAFGSQVMAAGGGLQREALARLVFADASARQELERILHPRIRAAWQQQLEHWRRENVALAVVVIPLLFETRAESSFDEIICAACLPASQIERLSARGWAPAHSAQRIAAQLPIAEKMARANYVVWTEGSLAGVGRQVECLVARPRRH